MGISPILKASFVALVLVANTGFAAAQSVQVLGDFRDWSAFSANDGGGVICFATSKPEKTQPVPDDYGEARIYLTNRTAEGIRSEFNLIAGFEFAPDSVATATIGSNTYDLFTRVDAAWLADSAMAQPFASNIRSGATLVIEGVTVRGVKVLQTYSLSGSTAASRSIDRAC